MRKKNNPEKIKLIALFFDPSTESENLTFSRICRFIRETFNLNQTEIAKKLGVTPKAYKFWETGQREPSSKIAFNLCLIYIQAIQIKQLNDSLELNSSHFNNIVINLADLGKLREYIVS